MCRNLRVSQGETVKLDVSPLLTRGLLHLAERKMWKILVVRCVRLATVRAKRID